MEGWGCYNKEDWLKVSLGGILDFFFFTDGGVFFFDWVKKGGFFFGEGILKLFWVEDIRVVGSRRVG